MLAAFNMTRGVPGEHPRVCSDVSDNLAYNFCIFNMPQLKSVLRETVTADYKAVRFLAVSLQVGT